MRICCFFLFFLTLMSCSSEDREVRKVLKLAGDNRGELEKVLDHYSQNPTDSLKYRAAVFLVKRMAAPDMKYQFSPRFEEFTEYMSARRDSFLHYLNASGNSGLQRLCIGHKFDQVWARAEERYGNPRSFRFNTYRDVNTISAELLIENIDYAFKAWNLPWSRDYTFDQFCRYILPYRYGDEPLESWRPYFWKKLQYVLDSMRGKDDPIETGQLINRNLDPFFPPTYPGRNSLRATGGGNLKPTTMLQWRMFKYCDDQCGLGCAAMRTMGMATSIIHIPAWGSRSVGHEYNAALDPQTGRWTKFSPGADYSWGPGMIRKPPKAFLNNYTPPAQNSNTLSEYQNMIDITHQYNNVVDIPVKVDPKLGKEFEFAYLATFDNTTWRPTMWGKIKDSKALFKDMGCGMLYLPVAQKGNQIFVIGEPLQVDTSGNITVTRPDTTEGISFTFTRKYPLSQHTMEYRSGHMNGGKFQVAHDSTFTNPVTLYTIKNCTTYLPKEVTFKPVKARYVRYHFPSLDWKYGKNGPGWIAFFKKTGHGYEKVTGNYLAAQEISKSSMDRIFDESLLTYVTTFDYNWFNPGLDLDLNFKTRIPYKTHPDSFWVGMDLGEPANIGKIGYCPRNDKNHIYPGLSYELHYWVDGWESLGVNTAGGHTVTFNNIPKGALLLLECLDEGKERRIFTIDENGKQVWW